MDSLKSFVPILDWLPRYSVKDFLVADIAGGLTLGCILMGQSLAHADLCKVSLVHGPYSCILPPIVYSLFGTCVHASVGTGGLVSLLTGEQLVHYGDDVAVRTQVGALMTLQVGLVLFLMGFCKLAFLVRFLSRPALSGFITASALLIILSQLAPMLGLPPWASKGGLVNIVLNHIRHLKYMNLPTVILSACTLAFLMNAKRLKNVKQLKFVSDFKELLLLAVLAVFCRHYNATHEDKITVVGSMPTGLPEFINPMTADNMRLAKELFPASVLVALVVFLSSFAGAKKFAMKDGYQIKAFNELIALGAANMAGAFNGAVPTQIGLSRMGIAHTAGVRTQLGANIFVAVIVTGITAALSGYMYNIPKCALNCIIVNGASHLTEFEEASRLLEWAKNSKYNWKSRMDIVVWLAGFGSTLYFGAFKGIIIAVIISLGLILYQVVNPEMTSLGYKASTHNAEGRARKWIRSTADDAVIEDGILVFRLEGPLFYANVESMQEWLEEQEVLYFEETGKVFKGIILSASAVPFVDTTAVSALQEMVKTYKERGILFFIANTFSQAGRIITDHVEPLEKNALKRQAFKEQVDKCSSIDDFVDLIKAHGADCGMRRALSIRAIPSGHSLREVHATKAQP